MRIVLFLAFLVPAVGSASSLSVVDLGNLGGAESVAYGVNSSGLAVGWASNGSGITNAFSSTGAGSPFDFSALESYAYGVNGAGSVAGVFYENGVSHGAIWVNGTMTDLGAGTSATSINDFGIAAGGNGQAIVYSDGQARELGTLPGGNWSAAYGINNSSEVVGYGNTGGGAFLGFYWTGQSLISIGTLGGSNSYAMGVNDSGEIVGDASTAAGYLHAFADSNGTLTDLGTLGGTSSYAYSVNDQGLVVGYSTTADGATHAFLYQNGEMVDLNSLLPEGSGWVLVQAYGINDQEQIVGTGLWNGQQEAFRLDLNSPSTSVSLASSPVPEPGAWILVLCGGALVAVSFWLRRWFQGGNRRRSPQSQA
ncbi:MAG TPA: DUF3466 family protein [Bryobacteraceae bacterium]|nr:DUF3466 family protein [Bryobacteraceae bacterium]